MSHSEPLPVQMEVWPTAWPETGCHGMFKSIPEDFDVEELPSDVPSGEGEHVWLWVEKRGANTVWVAAQLARYVGVKEKDVGFAGIKDRHAVTRQWFSIYLPRQEAPDLTQIEHEEYRVIEQTRHARKLRRGELTGNRFVIRLRNIRGNRDALESNLEQLKTSGYPNYFGEQRFGHDGGNLEAGMAMLTGKLRVRQHNKKSIYLSAVRSWLFNQVVAERVRQDNWTVMLPGDPESFPTGPLWGRGRSAAHLETGQLETRVTDRCTEVCDALEHAGLSQERRALQVRPVGLYWEWCPGEEKENDSDLILTFTLGAGYYATSLLRELLTLEEPERVYVGGLA